MTAPGDSAVVSRSVHLRASSNLAPPTFVGELSWDIAMLLMHWQAIFRPAFLAQSVGSARHSLHSESRRVAGQQWWRMRALSTLCKLKLSGVTAQPLAPNGTTQPHHPATRTQRHHSAPPIKRLSILFATNSANSAGGVLVRKPLDRGLCTDRADGSWQIADGSWQA